MPTPTDPKPGQNPNEAVEHVASAHKLLKELQQRVRRSSRTRRSHHQTRNGAQHLGDKYRRLVVDALESFVAGSAIPVSTQMEITIQESCQSFRSEYEIETPSSCYSAQKAMFSFPAQIKLQSSDERTLATVQSRLSFFREKYDFTLSDGRFFRFWCRRDGNAFSIARAIKPVIVSTDIKASSIPFFRMTTRSRLLPRIVLCSGKAIITR